MRVIYVLGQQRLLIIMMLLLLFLELGPSVGLRTTNLLLLL
jgi:hypothetical protein